MVGDGNKISDSTMLYFGSHNFSPSAWGNMEKKDTQIHIANWELGVVFPPEIGTQKIKEEIVKSLPLKLVDLKKYGSNDMPFIFS